MTADQHRAIRSLRDLGYRVAIVGVLRSGMVVGIVRLKLKPRGTVFRFYTDGNYVDVFQSSEIPTSMELKAWASLQSLTTAR